ncbi:hypothetical protein CEXT_489111, partial [Caerostris extrusa]
MVTVVGDGTGCGSVFAYFNKNRKL